MQRIDDEKSKADLASQLAHAAKYNPMDHQQLAIGIRKISQDDRIDDGFKQIQTYLTTIKPEHKENLYTGIFIYFFDFLLENQHYQKMIDLGQSFINHFMHEKPTTQPLSPVDNRFISNIHKRLSQAYKHLGQTEQAKQCIQESIRIEKENNYAPDAKQHLFNSALAQLTDSITIMTLRYKTNVHVAQAQECLQKHQFREAATEYEQALACNKELLKQNGLPEAKKQEIQLTIILFNGHIARYYKELNDLDTAFKYISAAIDRCSTHGFENIIWFYFLQRAQLYLLTKKPENIDKAYTEFSFARLSPDYLTKLDDTTHIQAAELNHLLRELIPAVHAVIQHAWTEDRHQDIVNFTQIYLDFIENDPRYSRTSLYFNLALAQQSLRHYPHAMIAINHAISHSNKEDHGIFYRFRAELHKDMGNFKEARADIQSAMKYLKHNYPLIMLKKEIDAHFRVEHKAVSKPKQKKPIIVIEEPEPVKESHAAITAVAPKPTPVNEIKPTNTIKENPLIAQKKALKKQQMKQKKELAEKNRLHQQAISCSRSIIQQLLDKSIQLSEKKQQEQAATDALRRTAFKSIATTAAIVAKQQQLRKSILTQQQFANLCQLNEKVVSLGAKLRIYGSSVFAFQFPRIKHHDIDIQIYDIPPKQSSHIIKAMSECHYTYSRTGQQNEYMQFTSQVDNKAIEATLVLDAKLYNQHIDPINITHCGLIIKRLALGQPYLDIDEHGVILAMAQKKGYFDVNLSVNLAQTTCLFARIIKYARMFDGILAMRIITGNEAFILTKNSWNHPTWRNWLFDYFIKRLTRGGETAASCYKEINQLIKRSYLHHPEAEAILLAFCSALLTTSAIHKLYASYNMVNSIRQFYQHHTGDFHTITHHITYLTKNYPEIQNRMLSTIEMAIICDKLVHANLGGASTHHAAPRYG